MRLAIGLIVGCLGLAIFFGSMAAALVVCFVCLRKEDGERTWQKLYPRLIIATTLGLVLLAASQFALME